MSFAKVIVTLVALLAVCLLALWINNFLGSPPVKVSRRYVPDPPKLFHFPKNYHATGRLLLPHSKIEEPFEVWFSGKHNRSRVDYYYGTDKTFQLADVGPYGMAFKVVPMFADRYGSYTGCWHLFGSPKRPVVVQPIVPNMTDFKFASYDVFRGTATTKWIYQYRSYGLMNTHTLWVTTAVPPRPVRYEMKGYDNLLASYYDNYVLEYISFEEWKPDLAKYELPKGSECYNLSRTYDRHLVGNPMQEFMPYGSQSIHAQVDHMYKAYTSQHNKVYDTSHEHNKRKHIFRHNMRYIRSINRKNLKYKLAPNHFVDLSQNEFDQHQGLDPKENQKLQTGGVRLRHRHHRFSNMSHVLKRVDVPDELDWRDYGAVTPVRGQGICGSCYALAAVGAVEGAYFMKTGKLRPLSAQQVMDCSWGSGNHGCRGGYYNKALSWIYLHGVASAEDYGLYLAQEGTCKLQAIPKSAFIDAFAFVPKHNNTALKTSVAKFGPAAVSINQTPFSLKFYSKGIYDDPECDNSSTLHTVLVVGYGQENGVPFWLIKNSWSTSWGMDGYMKLAWNGNTCGVTDNPVVALIKHNTFNFPSKIKTKADQQPKPQGTHDKKLTPKGTQRKKLDNTTREILKKEHSMRFTSRRQKLRWERKERKIIEDKNNQTLVLGTKQGVFPAQGSEKQTQTKRPKARPFAGKLQNIYDQLNKLIEKSLNWKNRDHVLRYTHDT